MEGLLIPIKTLFTLNEWYSSRSKRIHLSVITVNRESCACKIANPASRSITRHTKLSCVRARKNSLLPLVMYRSIPKPPMPPPGQTPGHLTFWKNFGQIPRYVASLDGQMPHPLELQRGSNPSPSRHVKQTVETSCGKIFSHYEFLVQLVFAPHFKQRHIPR